MTKILNIDILSLKKKEFLEQLEFGVVFTPNVDHIVRLQKTKTFYEAYQQADWIICDSVILHRCSHLLSKSIKESIPGSTLFHEFCNLHREDENCRIFILGGKEGVAKQAQRNINKRVEREMVVGAHSPSFSFVNDECESKQLVQMINSSGATVLMVCATSPKQEIWITRYRYQMTNVRLFLALGATVDFEAGCVKRCPLSLQRLGLEWFWRFCHEPKRLFRRYFIDDVKFFWYFLKQLLGIYNNPFR